MRAIGLARISARCGRATSAPFHSCTRSMAMAENYVTPRSPEEEATLLGMRYGVKPTPGCQLMPPDIHNWTPTEETPEPAKPVPNTATVFGATGMLGKAFLSKVGGKFKKIRIACRDPAAAQNKLSAIEGNFEYVTANVEDVAQVAAACEGAGTVVNMVGILFETSTSIFAKVQYEGAANIAHAAKTAGAVRMVHVSAIGAVDQSRSKYAQSKGWGEGAVRARFPEASILRPSVVFGPEDNFFNQFSKFPLPFWPLVGGGNTKFQPVYVDDVAEALAKCALGTAGKGATYELGGPDVMSFKEILGKIKEVTGKGKAMVPIPFAVAEIQGWFMELMPTPMITQDQVIMLQSDNTVADSALGFDKLGITPKSVDEVVPTYLK